MIKVRFEEQLKDQFWYQLGAQICDPLASQLRVQLWQYGLRAQLWQKFRDHLRTQLQKDKQRD